MDIAQRIESIETRLEVNTISNTSSNCNNTSSLNEISDCILPLDNTTDLDTFNDKISGDRAFQINLVRKQYLHHIFNYQYCWFAYSYLLYLDSWIKSRYCYFLFHVRLINWVILVENISNQWLKELWTSYFQMIYYNTFHILENLERS